MLEGTTDGAAELFECLLDGAANAVEDGARDGAIDG